MYERPAAEMFRYSNPMREFGDPVDVAQAVVYLATPAAKFITGEVMVIDGGNNQMGDVWPGACPNTSVCRSRGDRLTEECERWL